MSFDPNAVPYNKGNNKSNNGKKENRPVADGRHPLTMYWAKIAQGKRGAFMKVAFRAIAGSSKGGSFFTIMPLSLDREGSRQRWKGLCVATGVNKSFDPADEAAVLRLFKNKPFWADVKTTPSGQYNNTNIESFWPREELSEVESELLEQFESRSVSNDLSDPQDQEAQSDLGFGDDGIPF